MFVELGENSAYVFQAEIELIFAALCALQGAPDSLFQEVYGPTAAADLQAKYPFLTEVFQTLPAPHNLGILEPLLAYPLQDFSLVEYRRSLLAMEPAGFIRVFFSLNHLSEKDVLKAMEDDRALEELFAANPHLCKNLLGFQAMFRQTRRWLEDYFSLASGLATAPFRQALKNMPSLGEELMARVQSGLKEKDPLTLSQELMGKTFHNRGPYEKFYFSPSLFYPGRGMRLFDKDQILFVSVRPQEEGEAEMLRQLKAIADGTRFTIITLLKEKGPLRGLDIAQALSIAPSTVSHHMEQLKLGGLLAEEQVKNAKYYSLSLPNIAAMLKRLNDTLND